MIQEELIKLINEFNQKVYDEIHVILTKVQIEYQTNNNFISEPEARLFCENSLSMLKNTYNSFIYKILGLELNSLITSKEAQEIFAEFNSKSSYIIEKYYEYFLVYFRQLFRNWIVEKRNLCEKQLPNIYDQLFNSDMVFSPNQLQTHFNEIRKYVNEILGTEKYSYSMDCQDSYSIIIKYTVEPREKQLSEHFALKYDQENSKVVLDKICKLISLSLQKKADELAISETTGYSRRVLERSLNSQFQDLNFYMESELENNPFKEQSSKIFVEYCKNLQTDMIRIYETIRNKYLSDIFPVAEKIMEEKLDRLIVKIEEIENLEIPEVEKAFDDLCTDVFNQSVRNFFGWIKEEQDDPEITREELTNRFLNKYKEGQELMNFLESQVDTLKNAVIDEIIKIGSKQVVKSSKGSSLSFQEQKRRAEEWAIKNSFISKSDASKVKKEVKEGKKLNKTVEQQREDAFEFAEMNFNLNTKEVYEEVEYTKIIIMSSKSSVKKEQSSK